MTRTATKGDWETLPMPERSAEIAVNRRYTAAEFAHLAAGHVPGEMEDKWFVYYDEPWLCMHRSWTGVCVYRALVESDGECFAIGTALVNRDPKQYSATDDDLDAAKLERMMDRLAGRESRT